MAWGARVAGSDEFDLGAAEAGLTLLLEAWERAVEEVGAAIPPVQLRALLIIERTGTLNLNKLAAALGASASATSRLCDRMEAAGLLTRDRAASRREIELIPTEAGDRLAAWVRDQRRGALADVLRGMSRPGRSALTAGLGELAAGPQAAAGDGNQDNV